MNYYEYNTGQRPLQTTQRGLLIVFKWLFKMLVYAPLLVTGYFICTIFLNRKADALLWLGLTALFSFILYLLIQVLKNVLQTLKAKGNYWWIPLFIFFVLFTCILPAYLVYAPANYIVIHLKGNEAITVFLVICFALIVYWKYDFLRHK